MSKRSAYSRELDRSVRLVVIAVSAILVVAAWRDFAAAQSHPALPSAVVKIVPGLRPLGHGSHRLFGLRVYDASLWVLSATWNPDEPHALDVRVSRAIPSGRLDAGVDEMKRLGVGDDAKRRIWRSELAQVVPDLKNRDRMVAFVAPDRKTHFVLNGRERGAIDDPSFGAAFFRIWLDPGTSNPALRKSLLNR